jgi:uncharacterized protein YidB (DUF937 family)
MGLMDILNGMQNGPRGAQQSSPSSESGGMPTWMMALLGLLAYKAIKGGGLGNILGGNTAQPQAPQLQVPMNQGGGLGDLLGGMLGGSSQRPSTGGLGDLLAGGAAAGGLGGLLGGLLGGNNGGNALNGGLRSLLQDMEQNGHGDIAKSWVGSGPNQTLSQDDLANAVGLSDIDAVAQHTGMPREQILSELSQHLPEFVNQLTPEGRIPTDREASTWV